MLQPTWSYLQNVFDNVTKNNLKLMYLMATDHFDKLRNKALTNPAIDNLYQMGLPLYDAYINQYRTSGNVAANYRMNTRRFENLLHELSGTRARKWDVAIQTVFDITSNEYLNLMPNNRRPFQEGAYELRINAVSGLADRLANYPQLAALEQEIRAFLAQLKAARTSQQGVEGDDSGSVIELENSRYALAEVMHGIFGGLMALYYKDRIWVESFYELKYLRRSASPDNDDAPVFQETVTIEAASTNLSLQGKLSKDAVVVVQNTGNTPVTVYTAATKSSPEPADATYVEPGQSATLSAEAADTLLVLRNDSTTTATVIVELL